MIERIEINLLPAEYRIHRKKIQLKRENIYPVIIAGVIALTLSLISIYIQNSIRINRNLIKAVDQSIKQNRPIQNEINQLRNDKQTIEGKIRGLELIDVNREKWVRLLEEVSNRLPEYTWLTSLKEEQGPPPAIHIEGRTYSFPEVANFMSNLKECLYISSVDLSQIEQVSAGERIFRFMISCAVNDNAYLNSNADGAATGRGKQ